jgi:hypothetical protein
VTQTLWDRELIRISAPESARRIPIRFAGIGPEAVKAGGNLSWARSGIRTFVETDSSGFDWSQAAA